MHITVNRVKSDDDATLSIISINGKFECFGLEDEYREDKIPGETRIPAGYYNVGVRNVGGFDARYNRKFPTWHKGMLEICGVPNFQYVLIHVGNSDEDTAGCLLTGLGANTNGEITIQSSVAAYKALYEKVISEAIDGLLTIEYIDSDV